MDYMAYHEKQDFRAAAYHAKKVYPGPVGDLIYREITDWLEFGWRLGPKSRLASLVDTVMNTPSPE